MIDEKVIGSLDEIIKYISGVKIKNDIKLFFKGKQ
jgi:hypothetical protein